MSANHAVIAATIEGVAADATTYSPGDASVTTAPMRWPSEETSSPDGAPKRTSAPCEARMSSVGVPSASTTP